MAEFGDRVEEAVLLNFVAGLVAAFGGAFLGAGDPRYQHNALSHIPHQLLVAVPLGLIATLLLKPRENRTFWVSGASAMAGLVLANVIIIIAAVGLTH